MTQSNQNQGSSDVAALKRDQFLAFADALAALQKAASLLDGAAMACDYEGLTDLSAILIDKSQSLDFMRDELAEKKAVQLSEI